MFKFFRKPKGQSTLETAVLIIIVMGALLSIQVYIKRGLQGRLAKSADDIGDQYSYLNMNVSKTVVVKSNTLETNDAGFQATNLLTDEVTTTNSTRNLLNAEQEYWGNS